MEYASNGELYEHIVKKKKFFLKITNPKEKLGYQKKRLSFSSSRFYLELNIYINSAFPIGTFINFPLLNSIKKKKKRDLKLENLLLSHSNTIKIVDFGLSNYYDTNPLLLTSCGSPCYAAPEMILGQRYNGLKSDLWSLGIILFAMTCGYLPFENKDTAIMYKKVVRGEFEIPKNLSEEIKVLIKGLLTVDPKKRFSIEDAKMCSWYLKLKNEEANKGVIIGMHEIPVFLIIFTM